MRKSTHNFNFWALAMTDPENSCFYDIVGVHQLTDAQIEVIERAMLDERARRLNTGLNTTIGSLRATRSDVVKVIAHQIDQLDDSSREALVAVLWEGFCLRCGSRRTKKHPICHCENDE